MASGNSSDYTKVKDEGTPRDIEWLNEGDEKTRALKRCAIGYCALKVCAVLAIVFFGDVILLLLFNLAVYCFFPIPETCAIEDTDVTPLKAPYPLHVGTADNIVAGGAWPSSEIDLSGIWWLRWEDSDGIEISIYSALRLEIAATFANSRIMINDTYTDSVDPDGLGATQYPFELHLFGQQTRHWAYSDSYLSWANQMFWHALSWPVDEAIRFRFDNSTHAEVVGIGPFIKKNEDEWRRPTPVFGKEYTYTLTRIVNGTGDLNPTWAPRFEEHMAGHKLRVWGNEDRCGRNCEIISMLLGNFQYPSCKLCAFLCGYDGYAADDHE